ncbi:MAG: trimethylamine methyltransferase family protein [Alphaproteobacteria bacterium]|jgi:trimethylamine--corrinoid protein Co-methyltransferase|nr:trimethylamine methyltransferase family protein [Alphaproteobacteria bacterium]MDP6563770.1 trimethylamine methyltransferase family protein [Alphaproteobacteria bacterium]MDP6814096.1 trimethylamine methyltransferase family protein [Alphaproteobacteria bacterium]
MQPRLSFLSEPEIDRIVDGAFHVLAEIGVHIGSPRVLDIVASQDGVHLDGDRVTMNRDLVERSLKSCPAEVRLYRQDREEAIVLAGDRVNFVAGSTVPYVHDPAADGLREATARDLVNHTKVINRCDHIDLQSGSFVPSDVPKPIVSAYRYYLAMLYSPKPMFSGAFGTDDMEVIWGVMSALAGGEKELVARPLALLCVNPSSPLGLTEVVAENTAFLADKGFPTLMIPIPLAGGSSPVTLAGTLVQHTAENLATLVVSQSVRAGSPVIFGGGPSIMDMRKGTACQAATEAVIMGAGIGQIAKRLNLPSSTNTGRADSKCVDYQAGEESGAALTTMALARINLIRGSGTLEYANVISTAKMLIDNEICGMAKRLIEPIDTGDEALALDVIVERGASTAGYLSSPHTLKRFRDEFFVPSDLIDRGPRREFEEAGSKDAFARAQDRVGEILADYTPREIDADRKAEADRIIAAYAAKHGMDRLPITEIQ